MPTYLAINLKFASVTQNKHSIVDGLNCKFLLNPWQYKLGVYNNDNNDVSQFCKYKQFVVTATN